MKKLLCLVFAAVMVVFSTIAVNAAGINANEQSVLNQLKIPANMGGNYVYVPSSYVNQAESRFNTIDMTSTQASKINSIISQGRNYLTATGKKSVKELNATQKKKMIQYAMAAANVLNLSAVGGSDLSRVKVEDKKGNVVIDETGSVIKKTGFESGFPVGNILLISLAFATLISATGIVIMKKNGKI